MFRNEALNKRGISEDELVGEWNDYCEENSLYGEEIYPNTEDTFEEIMRNETPFEIAACAFRSAWNPGEKWVQYDVYLRSCNCPDELMRDEFIEAFSTKGEKDE